jgi:2'-5' RNA ligase
VRNQRLFVAIDLPDEMAGRLVALDPHYRGLNFSPVAQIHLTLAFFASVSPATVDALKEKLAAISFRAFFFQSPASALFRNVASRKFFGLASDTPIRICFNCTSA